MRPWQLRIRRINSWLVVLLAFFLPISTSAVTVAAFLLIAGWFLEGAFKQRLREIGTNPVCLAVFAYLGVMAIGLFWSAHITAGFAAIEEQSKILMLPLFLTAVRHEHRWRYLGAFVAGVTVIMCSTYLAWFGLLQYADVTPLHLTKKTTHVFYNPMLAFAIYLLLHQLCWGGVRGWRRWPLLALVGLMVFNMFITAGRTGQLVFFVLMALLLIQCFPKNLMKAGLLTVLLLPLVFTVSYLGSPVFRERIDLAHQEMDDYSINPRTSVGQRLQYWKNSSRIIVQHPWLGVGTGDFFSAYARVNWLFSRDMPFTDNPHNQYILTTVQSGLLGLVSLLALFVVQMVQAWRIPDGWGRIRVAFPLFFLVIMVTESYLVIVETCLLFALVGAVLGKREENGQIRTDRQTQSSQPSPEEYWLILSYRANIPGSACSQHIDDRLPLLQQTGITPVLLTGPVGGHSGQYPQYRAWSLAPSGIRFEVRHALRKRLQRRWQFKLVETLLLLPVMPLYLLEKVLINLESEWSWFVMASIRGLLLQRRYRPTVVYSTGGSASAHMAALLISRFSRVRWLAETQDPLVHDHDWQRSRVVYSLYRWLERQIAVSSNAFIFLTDRALENARQRIAKPFTGVVIRPGAPANLFGTERYAKGAVCRFAHFGSLAGSRNLMVLLTAIDQLVREKPRERSRIRVECYGSLDGASETRMKELGLRDLVVNHGLIDRQEAVREMQQADCLLLIQNTTFFATETIPSKVYEYLLSGRPILALLHGNEELSTLLGERGHFVVAADDPQAVREAMEALLRLHAETEGARLSAQVEAESLLVMDAVRQLIRLARDGSPTEIEKDGRQLEAMRAEPAANTRENQESVCRG